jgi:L-galactonate dehydratase
MVAPQVELMLISDHFRYPSKIEKGYYCTPLEPGYSVEIYDSAIKDFEFPRGTFWASDEARALVDRMINGL